MKATYETFLKENANCSGFEYNQTAKAVFDFLNSDEQIIKMADYADLGKPALAGCVLDLEKFYSTLDTEEFSFEDDFNRTVVGRMVKTILTPFGYVVTRNKPFSASIKSAFSSASCYVKAGQATMRIVKRVEVI